MKFNYEPPRLVVSIVCHEHSIATGSATATFIGPSATNSPDVEAWNVTPNDANDNPHVLGVENW
ncbi:hypothetical protein [Sphingobacterium sp.]|uniref:hypothetical protein n=1 Tax=Sphingobacterium sp. TaxID=341027 RepID=UPI00289C3C23|nr:hypothetical protein [Sphingobacterium sp.]